MSDGEVRAALEQMSAWLANPGWEPNPEELAQWTVDYQAALSRAEKSKGWPEVVADAHELGRRLEARTAQLALQRDGVRAELEAQERGNRALKGYGASAR